MFIKTFIVALFLQCFSVMAWAQSVCDGTVQPLIDPLQSLTQFPDEIILDQPELVIIRLGDFNALMETNAYEPVSETVQNMAVEITALANAPVSAGMVFDVNPGGKRTPTDTNVIFIVPLNPKTAGTNDQGTNKIEFTEYFIASVKLQPETEVPTWSWAGETPFKLKTTGLAYTSATCP